MSEIPVLETERLILRGHTLADLDALTAMWTDPAVTGQIGLPPQDEAACWQRLLRYAGTWALLGYGFWAIQTKADGRYVGDLGFADFRRGLQPGWGDAAEAGWSIAPAAQGKGYAGEALKAGLVWADAHFGPGSRTVCMIDPDNVPSQRLAARAGYREWSRTEYKGSPVILYERYAAPAGEAG